MAMRTARLSAGVLGCRLIDKQELWKPPQPGADCLQRHPLGDGFRHVGQAYITNLGGAADERGDCVRTATTVLDRNIKAGVAEIVHLLRDIGGGIKPSC
jgi:hypothetical protein